MALLQRHLKSLTNKRSIYFKIYKCKIIISQNQNQIFKNHGKDGHLLRPKVESSGYLPGPTASPHFPVALHDFSPQPEEHVHLLQPWPVALSQPYSLHSLSVCQRGGCRGVSQSIAGLRDRISLWCFKKQVSDPCIKAENYRHIFFLENLISPGIQT